MANGITREDVAAAMDSIASEGQEPTVRRVRQLLQTGSFGTISKFMSAVRLDRSTPDTGSEQLPVEIEKLVRTLTQGVWKAARASARTEAEALRKTVHEETYGVEASLEQVQDLMGEITTAMSKLHIAADQRKSGDTPEPVDEKDTKRPDTPDKARH